MKKKHVLVITDNPNLAFRFENEVWKEVNSPELFNLTFKCSPFSSANSFKLKKKIEIINLKNEEEIEDILSCDLILSIHCKQLFPKKLVEFVRCINVHPGYNPINRGWFPQVFAIINDLDIGATIHEIDEDLDHGRIIAREKVEKLAYDTSCTLYKRINEKEVALLKKHINNILQNSYEAVVPENKGNLFLKKDFNKQCALDLNQQLTMGKAIDKLRALTHENFNNAYFYDEFGNKIFVSIKFVHEA